MKKICQERKKLPHGHPFSGKWKATNLKLNNLLNVVGRKEEKKHCCEHIPSRCGPLEAAKYTVPHVFDTWGWHFRLGGGFLHTALGGGGRRRPRHSAHKSYKSGTIHTRPAKRRQLNKPRRGVPVAESKRWVARCAESRLNNQPSRAPQVGGAPTRLLP